ncbi:MAG: ATP-binding cassette domain-containing protein, partial [bacterium]|nr:ATP-binding cassette domain-containing protein [bacterium]
FKKNHITSIIGPSGCGKTTLLKSINRTLEIHNGYIIKGSVFFDSIDLYKVKRIEEYRKRIGFLAQKPIVFPMSIYENVAYGIKVNEIDPVEQLKKLEKQCPFCEVETDHKHKIIKGKELDFLVETYLRVSGLWEEVFDKLHQPAYRLSVGQQQRLCLARMLAVEPEVILADEPTANLDPLSTKFIEEVFCELKKYYTIIFVTHNLEQAKKLADDIVFIYKGEVVEMNSKEKFFSNPISKKSKNYLDGVDIES